MATRGIRTYNLDHNVGQQIDAEAARLGISKSELANRLLTEALSRRVRLQTAEALRDAGTGVAVLVGILALVLL